MKNIIASTFWNNCGKLFFVPCVKNSLQARALHYYHSKIYNWIGDGWQPRSFLYQKNFTIFYKGLSCKSVKCGDDTKASILKKLNSPWVLGLHERELNQLNANLLFYHFFHVFFASKELKCRIFISLNRR
jgi:hypothetical protein